MCVCGGGGVEDRKRVARVWWEDVCLPKEKGGLGVKNIRKFNVALHRKWRWRLPSCQNELWYKVLCSKYGR